MTTYGSGEWSDGVVVDGGGGVTAYLLDADGLSCPFAGADAVVKG